MNTNLRWILAGIAVYLVVGGLVLAMKQEDLRGKNAAVWNMVSRATEVLGRLENQVTVFLKDRKDLIAQITVARNDMLAAQQTENLQALAVAEQKTSLAIKAVFEAYPDVSLVGVQQGLMDETAGSINRVSYVRKDLIDAQVSYNQMRILFFPLAMFFPRADVLGESFNAAAPLPTSSFGKP